MDDEGGEENLNITRWSIVLQFGHKHQEEKNCLPFGIDLIQLMSCITSFFWLYPSGKRVVGCTVTVEMMAAWSSMVLVGQLSVPSSY